MNRRQFLSLSAIITGAISLAGRYASATPVEERLTGLLYDEVFLDHWLQPGHPESPARLRAIFTALEAAGLFEQTHPLGFIADPDPWIRTIHTGAHMRSLSRDHPRGHEVTRKVVAGVLDAVDAVCSGKVRNAFCVTRPPGHHAENTGRVEGFCFYNTVAIAARYAQQQFKLEKILIVDWDYHHGNGTESAFYEDSSVLFFSTHDYYAYPGTGDPKKTGSGAGEGTNINIHLPCGTTDEMIQDAFTEHLLPAAEAFRPDMILISAGFDSRKNDLLGCYRITDEGFAELTRMVMSLADRHCDGRLISVLEGGYTPSGLASATLAHVQTLMGGG
jgi:acetoin utilization deacetylase AcuC-like enzyme